MPSKRKQAKNATVEDAIEALEKNKIGARTATGEWAATPKSRDMHVSIFYSWLRMAPVKVGVLLLLNVVDAF